MNNYDKFWKGIHEIKQRVFRGEEVGEDEIKELRKKYVRYKIQRIDDLKRYPDSDELIKSIQEAILKVNNGQPMHENDCFKYWHMFNFIVIDEEV